MKVLALNSSLRKGGQSRTELMLTTLVEGMRDKGAEVEVVHLREKKIKYCVGCFSCMTNQPGRCILKDDMTEELFPKWLECDTAIYATPLFHYTVNAPMKAFIERTWPVYMPFLEIDDQGKDYHSLRYQHPSVVFVSVCGFPDQSNFDVLSQYVHCVFGKWLIAELYRTAAMPMVQSIYREHLSDIQEATRLAGRELVEVGKISPELQERITQPIDTPEKVSKIANIFWKTCIARGITTKTSEEKGVIPRPDSLETFLIIMKEGFREEAYQNRKVLLQFNFSGEVKGPCHFILDRGAIEAGEGTIENPDISINAPFEVWMDVITGKADGQQMFMDQKYTVEGDIELMMQLFRSHSDA